MKKIFLLLLLFCAANLFAQTSIRNLDSWKFSKGDNQSAPTVNFNDEEWETVKDSARLAIYGPFDKEIDKQLVQIVQNNEKVASEKTSRTGALPFIGVGWYRMRLSVPEFTEDKKAILAFDGAMSNAQVFVNGQRVGIWPYGYSYFYFDITAYLKNQGVNTIAVRLENHPISSRWNPVPTLPQSAADCEKQRKFQQGAHFITTPYVTMISQINIRSHVQAKTAGQNNYSRCRRKLVAKKNPQRLATKLNTIMFAKPEAMESQRLILHCRNAHFRKYAEDTETIRFLERTIKYSAEKGFELNGKVTKFKGVCLHHDLGPLGAAINKAALRRQLTILKDMGCNAIRSSHNMPSIEQLELCDEMGFLFLAESFDEWKKPKVKNGYNLYFDEWAEKDVVNLVHATRNHPCIVMWEFRKMKFPINGEEAGVKRAMAAGYLSSRRPDTSCHSGNGSGENNYGEWFRCHYGYSGSELQGKFVRRCLQTIPQGILLGFRNCIDSKFTRHL
jgi:beta-galactosidase